MLTMLEELFEEMSSHPQFEWRLKADEVLEWLSTRPGWERGGLDFEYRPSMPACLRDDADEDRSEHPCQGTVITVDLEVFTPEASCSLCLAQIPDGQPAYPGPTALTVGYDDPHDIRRHIDLIESLRWWTPDFGILTQVTSR